MNSDNKFIDLDQYDLIGISLGEGGFSNVHKVKNKKTKNTYAAKISKFMVDESTQNMQETKNLFREINLMYMIKHPSIIQFFGYSQFNFDKDPCPTLILELATNGSLRSALIDESRGLAKAELWNFTKKLINIYGIALGMSYLHSHNILHRDLKPENILLSEDFYPKISDFGLSKFEGFISKSLNYQSQKGIKGTIAYIAPEIINEEKYSTASDVYAFAFIVFELFSKMNPFEGFTFNEIREKVGNQNYRPKIERDVPEAYKNLIEKCWSQKPEERPSFDEIVSDLRFNTKFITDEVEKTVFDDYIDLINEFDVAFRKSKQLIHFEDFIKFRKKNKMANEKLQKEKLDENDDSLDEKIYLSLINEQEKNESSDLIEKNDQINSNELIDEQEFESLKIVEVEQIVYPSSEFNKLSKECQKIVEEAQNDPNKQFVIGKNLIEGENGFPKNIDLGIQYINHSNSQNCIDSMIYYIKQLISGKNIPMNIRKAEKYLNKIGQSKDKRIFELKGKLKIKEKKFKEAKEFFELGTKEGDIKCMYNYAKMFFLGEGTPINATESFKYMKLCQEKGYEKSDYFLKAFKMMVDIDTSFVKLPAQTQFFFISTVIHIFIENKNNKEFNENLKFEELKISIFQTEKMFFNRSFYLLKFHKFLEKFQKVNIEIQYPSDSFESKSDIIIKNKKNSSVDVTIGIVFCSLPFINEKNILFSKDFSYHRIDDDILTIPKGTFKDCDQLKQIIIPSSITSIDNYAFSNCTSLNKIIISSSSSIKSIGNYAFLNCSMIEEINLPSSIETIGSGSFNNCSSLKEINLHPSITSIGNYAFKQCTSLKQVIIPSLIKSIKWGCFCDCTSLTKIEIPYSVTSIESHSFENCSSLKKIVFPSSITSIGEYALSKCSSLEIISFPFVNSIGNYVLSECKSLKHISIPPSVVLIGDYALSECSSLEEISIPSSVTSIGNYAFYKCSSLKEIRIPSSVNNIGKNAFADCSSLKQVALPSSINKSKLGFKLGTKIKKF